MARSGYVTVGDLRMYYEDHGDGPPLVLLPGAMGTIESCFAELLPRLAARRRVIAVEPQGHGHTPDIDRPLTLGGLADDTAALATELDLGPADYMGYSVGGAVAFQLAMRYPDLVKRLVFAGGTSFRPAGQYPEMFEAPASVGDLDGSDWQKAYARVAPDPDAWHSLVAKVLEMDKAYVGWSAAEVQAVAAPILLIIGDSDLVRPEHTMEMFRLLGGGVLGDLHGLPPSRLAILPGTTHSGLLDRVEWLASMTLDFLDQPERVRG